MGRTKFYLIRASRQDHHSLHLLPPKLAQHPFLCILEYPSLPQGIPIHVRAIILLTICQASRRGHHADPHAGQRALVQQPLPVISQLLSVSLLV